jgi:hypothetical protein
MVKKSALAMEYEFTQGFFCAMIFADTLRVDL